MTDQETGGDERTREDLLQELMVAGWFETETQISSYGVTMTFEKMTSPDGPKAMPRKVSGKTDEDVFRKLLEDLEDENTG